MSRAKRTRAEYSEKGNRTFASETSTLANVVSKEHHENEVDPRTFSIYNCKCGLLFFSDKDFTFHRDEHTEKCECCGEDVTYERRIHPRKVYANTCRCGNAVSARGIDPNKDCDICNGKIKAENYLPNSAYLRRIQPFLDCLAASILEETRLKEAQEIEVGKYLKD